ncbi:MAG: hypothetical protein IPJ74_02850 [Saprospiraceae bacterium]|nr:hypothetical protein [Saprospiraceae bacterium]
MISFELVGLDFIALQVSGIEIPDSRNAAFSLLQSGLHLFEKENLMITRRTKLTISLILLVFWLHILTSQTTILLVGTVHAFEDSTSAVFEPLRQKLIAFQPDVICIESIPTWDTLSLQAVRSSSIETAKQLRQEKGWQAQDITIFIKEYHEKLKLDTNNMIYHSQLANALYANHDFWNAYYHWFVLSQQLKQHPDLQSDKELNSTFALSKIHERTALYQAKTEYGHIIFPVAKALNHLYLYNIDERSDDAEFAKEGKKLAWRLVFNFKVFKLLKMYKKEKRLMTEMTGNEVIEYINSADFRQRFQELFDDAPVKYSKSKRTKYLIALWEKRNQEMANRIAQTIQSTDTQKVIVFFGAAHVEPVKRYLEKMNNYKVITLGQL